MSIYRIYAGADGESHLEEVHLAQHPELGALMRVAQVGIHEFSALRTMDFHPLPERRLIIHLRGEVEIGVSDGTTQIFLSPTHWVDVVQANSTTIPHCEWGSSQKRSSGRILI
jgi:hypothetical protein